MHIATEGDLLETESMSEEGHTPSDYEPISLFLTNSQDTTKEVKKGAFEITSVVNTTGDIEDLETSVIGQNRISGGEKDNSDDDFVTSPSRTDVFGTSTPNKHWPSGKDASSQSTLLTAAVNGPAAHHAPSRFRKLNDYRRDRWQVVDSVEVDADEYSETSESRGSVHKMSGIDVVSSTSSSPNTPRRNVDVVSSSNLLDAKSEDELSKTEVTTLTEPSTITLQQVSIDNSHDADDVSGDDNLETASQDASSEESVKIDTEVSPFYATQETDNTKIEFQSLISGVQGHFSRITEENEQLKKENATLKKHVQSLSKQVDQLAKQVDQLTKQREKEL